MTQQRSPIERQPAAGRLVSWPSSIQSLVGFALVGTLLVLGAANIALRATWHHVEDGVLWASATEGVVARAVAPGTPAASSLRPGDLLQAINGRPVDRVEDVYRVLESSRRGAWLRYTVLRLDSSQLIDVRLEAIPTGNLPLYFVLAAVGLFSLLVGLSVRVRRPADPATLHFFLLSLAFFGAFTFSFSGRLDRLDWVFYWANEAAILLLPPLFLHFTMAFPERTVRPGVLPRWLPLVYVPAAALGVAEIYVFSHAGQDAHWFIDRLVPLIDRAEYLYLAVALTAGFLVWVSALRRVRTVTGRRQLRWIVSGVVFGAGPFVFGYALPYSLGSRQTIAMSLLAVPLGLLPLAFASAIVRYRLMDVEVIIKRTLVYAAAILAIGGIYTALLRLASLVFRDTSNEHTTIIAMLATLVVVLLARPVKSVIQTTFDRAFYRDRYDYRRALIGFARDLNSDLDLTRLSDRLVARIMETFAVDRMALMLADDATHAFAPIRQAGLEMAVPSLMRGTRLGARVVAGQSVALDDPGQARSLPADEAETWRQHEVYYFVPCMSKEGCIAVLALGRRTNGEPLNSEDVSLLLAVAGQVATALENGRLYRQLRGQAEEVDRMREFSDSIIESLEAGLVVVDANARVARWNRALERLYGVSRDEAIGRPLSDLFDIGFLSQLHAVRSQAPSAAGVYRLSLHPRGRGDERLLVNVTVVPLRSWQGAQDASVVGTIIILDDVTSRVQLEEQLQISEKMASIGILAAGVAHEVNTPLTGISSFTQMLLEGADPDDPRTKMLEKIERQTFRAAKIVNGLLNLARPGSVVGERTTVDLNAVVNDVLSLLEHQFRVARIQVRRELASPAPLVAGFEFKLQQVFLNLFLNARDAMPKGGWLSISTRVDGDQVIADVSDTGTGIPREHLSRIYDPFFTTKAIGQGTGLGLSITYGIVREHDGSIACDSAAGEGTRFSLAFPLAEVASGRQDRIAT